MYRHPIIIQYMDEAEEWQDYYTCHARVNGLNGSEFWAARAVQAQNTVTFTVRFCGRLQKIFPQGYRIVFQGRIYDIQAIDNFEYRNRDLKIKAVMKYDH